MSDHLSTDDDAQLMRLGHQLTNLRASLNQVDKQISSVRPDDPTAAPLGERRARALAAVKKVEAEIAVIKSRRDERITSGWSPLAAATHQQMARGLGLLG